MEGNGSLLQPGLLQNKPFKMSSSRGLWEIVKGLGSIGSIESDIITMDLKETVGRSTTSLNWRSTRLKQRRGPSYLLSLSQMNPRRARVISKMILKSAGFSHHFKFQVTLELPVLRYSAGTQNVRLLVFTAHVQV